MKRYKSPAHKLISFFEQSRDQWKAKYMNAQKKVKYLKNRLYFLDRSKEHWKEKAKTLERKLKLKESQYSRERSRFIRTESELKKN